MWLGVALVEGGVVGCAWVNAKWVGYDGELASFPLIDTAGAISVKEQRCLGGQKTEAGSAAVNAHFRGIEFKSWALYLWVSLFKWLQCSPWGSSALGLIAFCCPGKEGRVVCCGGGSGAGARTLRVVWCCSGVLAERES